MWTQTANKTWDGSGLPIYVGGPLLNLDQATLVTAVAVTNQQGNPVSPARWQLSATVGGSAYGLLGTFTSEAAALAAASRVLVRGADLADLGEA
jgi:hypothetical protein